MKPIAKAPSISQKPVNQLRIIGGSWRGRKLRFPDVDGLRPTGDRIRETLFNWLAPDIQGARCLDVFAGSGALGVEALSRGAALSVFIERDATAAAQLTTNLQALNAQHGQVIRGDSLAYLQAGNTGETYTIAFIDPPFARNFWQATIDALEQGNWLADGACIYLEAGKDISFTPPAHWQLHREKHAGQVTYRLYYRNPGGNL